MIQLTREVRCSLIPDAEDRPVTNSWGGWPAATSIAPYVVFRCTLAGELDETSSYLCNIKWIDDAIRRIVIQPACERYRDMTPEALTVFAFDALQDAFPANCRLQDLQLITTPTLQFSIQFERPNMIQLTQEFEFSASHRLHNAELSDAENQLLFGKCNNPHGHGHNYVLQVTLEGVADPVGALVPLPQFEALVKQAVIDRLDHRHLNEELDEFRKRNPSVENIAIVIWDLLAGPVQTLGNGQARLARVRVFETPKTWADYQGPEN